MANRVFIWLLFMLALAFGAAAQSSCANLDVPVLVLRASGQPMEGLKASDFTGQIKRQAVSIQSVDYEASPRRILFVIDTSKLIPAEARKAQAEFASGVLSSAQPEDTFALLTARGITQHVEFSSERAAITKSLNVLESSSSEAGNDSKHPGVLDAVEEGIGWFGEPKPGDTIILMARDLEGNHKANYKNVLKTLEEHHIRLFGVAFGHLLLTNTTGAALGVGHDGFGYVQPGIPIRSSEAGEPNFLPLTVNSGGYVVPEDTMLANREFKLTEAKRQELQKTAELMVNLIDKFYSVRIAGGGLSHPEPWSFGLRETPAGVHVLYPHELACGDSGH